MFNGQQVTKKISPLVYAKQHISAVFSQDNKHCKKKYKMAKVTRNPGLLYNRLGKTDMVVSNVSLGGAAFGIVVFIFVSSL